MFYESQNSLGSDLFKIESGCDFSFPPHLHSSFELIAVTEGEMAVTVDKKQYALTAGRALLIFPDQVHTLATATHSRHTLCIFSPLLVRAYSNSVMDKLPRAQDFTPGAFYLGELMRLAPTDNLSRIKGLLYSLCGEFDAGAVYEARESEKKDLLLLIFQFVKSNYGGNCSLEALSAHISYHSVYLSRYFKRYTGLTFTDYVTQYRINEAAYLLKNSRQKILNVALECGFDSLRSFNRSFKRLMHTTPSAYRTGAV